MNASCRYLYRRMQTRQGIYKWKSFNTDQTLDSTEGFGHERKSSIDRLGSSGLLKRLLKASRNAWRACSKLCLSTGKVVLVHIWIWRMTSPCFAGPWPHGSIHPFCCFNSPHLQKSKTKFLPALNSKGIWTSLMQLSVNWETVRGWMAFSSSVLTQRLFSFSWSPKVSATTHRLHAFRRLEIQCLISKIDTVDSYPNCPRRARLERCLNFLPPASSRAALDKRG